MRREPKHMNKPQGVQPAELAGVTGSAADENWLVTFHWMHPVQYEGELRAGYDTRWLKINPAVEFQRLYNYHGGNVSLIMAVHLKTPNAQAHA